MSFIESYTPTEKQRTFHASKAKFRAYIGGFGAGKTKAGVWEGIDLAMRYPCNRILMARDTMPDLRDTVMQLFFDECPSEFIYTYRKKDNTVVFRNGTELLFRSFRAYSAAPRNQNESKIKGLNLGAFYLDEANETTKQQFLLLQGRLRLDTVPFHCGWITTNPPNIDHWIPETFEGPKCDKSKYEAIHASSRENPHLPDDYVSNLEQEYPASWVKKFIDGEYGFMTAGDPVYQNFKETLETGNPWHCRMVKWRSQYGPVHRYWDFGWHRPAVVWAQMTPDLTWKVYKEYMGHQVYIQDFAPKVLDVSNKMFAGASFLDFCDPAGNQRTDKDRRTSVQILSDDFKVRMQFRFSLVTEGIDIIQKKLNSAISGEPAFQINPVECPILVAGFLGGYARLRAQDGRSMSSSEPIKDGYYEHLHDALRYGAVNISGAGSSHSGDFPVGEPHWATSSQPQAPVAVQPKTTEGGSTWTERRW
ncbi:MAG: phage terminase large subunit [Candidatus Paceibacterota bacterium]